jgi:drug/metabolite transporter (DMT)-like permease
MTARAILYAFLSAVLFGISAPAAKVFLGSTDPTVLAGLFYCGAGVGIALILRFVRPMLSRPGIGEMALRHGDLPWLTGAIIAGGVIGPVLLLVGLSRTDAATASLLLTLEGVATALMAWFLFHENFDRRIVLGMACLLTGVVILSWSGQPTISSVVGPLAIIGACIAWGLDNNLTRKVSLSDPLQIVELKGLVAGPVNLGLGVWMGGKLPGVLTIVAAGMVGSGLRRKSGAVRHSFASSRIGANKRVFLNRALFWRGRSDLCIQRANYPPVGYCRCTDGSRGLASRVGAPPTRPRP